MTIIIKQFLDIIRLLHSETGTKSLAWAVAMGFILGLSPTLSLQSLLVFLLLFLFRIQIGFAFLSAAFFKVFAYLADPAFDSLGQFLLELPALETTYSWMYNAPLVPLTKFNNSVVMGAGVVGFLMSPLVYLVAHQMIIKYRDKVVTYVANTKAWKYFKATFVYKWYVTYENLYGGDV